MNISQTRPSFLVYTGAQTEPITTSTWTIFDTIPRCSIFTAYSNPNVIALASVLVTVYNAIIPIAPAMVTVYGADVWTLASKIQLRCMLWLLPKRMGLLSCLVLQIVLRMFQQSKSWKLLSLNRRQFLRWIFCSCTWYY